MAYLDKLLEQTPESAYWMGFIMADGYMSGKRLKIALSEKDAQHLQKFVDFLGHPRPVKVSRGIAEFSIQEPENVSNIMSIFDINRNKTYEPPDSLPSYSNPDCLPSFLIGFIDGDGTITYQTGRETVVLRTVSHGLWLNYLKCLSEATKFGKVTVRSDGYVQLASHKHNDIVKLKQFAKSRNLPILDRKWNRVNDDLTVRGGMKYAVLDMIASGASNRQILDTIGCSAVYIYKLRKEGG